MQKTLQELIEQEYSEEIQTCWWIDTIREHKDFFFVILRDWIFQFQCILEKSLLGDLKLATESVVKFKWRVIKNEIVRLHQKEFVVESVEILSSPIEQIPIGWDKSSYPSLDQRLDYRYISLREPKIQLLFEIISFFEYELKKYCYEVGFTEIHTPKLLWSPSESGAELFSLDYFETTAYLAQSPQFYKQMAIASWFKKVMETGPVFRAEPSFTSRHVTEFTWVDFEIAYIESFEEVMKIEEEMLHSLFVAMKEKFWKLVQEMYGIEIRIPTLPFPKIKFEECIEILERQYGYKMQDGEDISSEWERLIAQYVGKEYGHDFVFITHYPSKVRAFYTMKSSDPKWSESFDLIYKWIEITSWAQREHRYELLKQQTQEKWMSPETIQFYLDFFRYWVPPHGGFWIWLMRIFMKMLDFTNIREVIFAPRDPKRLTP